MSIDAFLLILRLLFLVLLYLFLMQVVIAITRDLGKAASNNEQGRQTSAGLGHLVVVDSGTSDLEPGTRFNLEPLTTIGRGPTNVIRLQDPSVSAENTRLSYRNSAWYVQDAGSRNGTYVNDQPARDPVRAKPGDIVRVGFVRFKLIQ